MAIEAKAPNGLAFSCRECAADHFQNTNDLAREAVSCNAGLGGYTVMVYSQRHSIPYYRACRTEYVKYFRMGRLVLIDVFEECLCFWGNLDREAWSIVGKLINFFRWLGISVSHDPKDRMIVRQCRVPK